MCSHCVPAPALKAFALLTLLCVALLANSSTTAGSNTTVHVRTAVSSALGTVGFANAFELLRNCWGKHAEPGCVDADDGGGGPLVGIGRIIRLHGHISDWHVGGVTNMSRSATYALSKPSQFNADLSKWDVSRVESTEYLFGTGVCAWCACAGVLVCWCAGGVVSSVV